MYYNIIIYLYHAYYIYYTLPSYFILLLNYSLLSIKYKNQLMLNSGFFQTNRSQQVLKL